MSGGGSSGSNRFPAKKFYLINEKKARIFSRGGESRRRGEEEAGKKRRRGKRGGGEKEEAGEKRRNSNLFVTKHKVSAIIDSACRRKGMRRQALESYPSGSRGRTRNALGRVTGAWVRIPCSPLL